MAKPRKPCNDCPFVKKTPLQGSPEWLKDVLKYHRENQFFTHSCHKTDPNADGYNGAKKTVGCAGHFEMQVNLIDKTPGLNGVYESIEELTETYLVHWLGAEKVESMKAAARLKHG